MTIDGNLLKDSNKNLYYLGCATYECYIEIRLNREKDSSDKKSYMNFLEIANLYGNHINQIQLRNEYNDGEEKRYRIYSEDLTLAKMNNFCNTTIQNPNYKILMFFNFKN